MFGPTPISGRGAAGALAAGRCSGAGGFGAEPRGVTGGSTVVPPGSADRVLAPDEAGPASAAAARASVAAPSATAYLGWASTTVGRPSSSEIIRETSGIQEQP